MEKTCLCEWCIIQANKLQLVGSRSYNHAFKNYHILLNSRQEVKVIISMLINLHI